MPQSYAIIPAAGRSLRMGRPKLLLPVRERMVIERVLDAWIGSRVSRVVVVARHDDGPLLQRCRQFDVDLVAVEAPTADMKQSVQHGLQHVQRAYRPNTSDAWLVAPADLPSLSRAVIDAVLDAYDAAAPTAVVPRIGNRRGHPVLFPWSCAPLVDTLPPDEGLNVLLDRLPCRPLSWKGGREFDDLDTPVDYARLVNEFTSAPATFTSPADAALATE